MRALARSHPWLRSRPRRWHRLLGYVRTLDLKSALVELCNALVEVFRDLIMERNWLSMLRLYALQGSNPDAFGVRLHVWRRAKPEKIRKPGGHLDIAVEANTAARLQALLGNQMSMLRQPCRQILLLQLRRQNTS